LNQQRVAVVGAGLAGLAVAARLSSAGREVTVLEADSRWGGQIHTLREGGLVVELGAEGFVARSRAVPALCELLGIGDSLVEQLTTDTYCLEGHELKLLAPGDAARRLGFQVPEEELGRGIRSLALGMGQLTDALVARIGEQRIRLGTAVKAISKAGDQLELRLADSVQSVDAVVVATSARSAAQLLQPFDFEPVAGLSEALVTSNVSVNLLFRREQFQRFPSGGGLLFPDGFAGIGLRACSFVDQKFLGRAPAQAALLRVFFRPSPEALSSWPEAKWIEEASAAIGQVLPFGGAPERAWVSHWVDALPVFSSAYRARAHAAAVALQRVSIHLAGSAFHGAGIDAAAVSAEAAAARLLAAPPA